MSGASAVCTGGGESEALGRTSESNRFAILRTLIRSVPPLASLIHEREYSSLHSDHSLQYDRTLDRNVLVPRLAWLFRQHTQRILSSSLLDSSCDSASYSSSSRSRDHALLVCGVLAVLQHRLHIQVFDRDNIELYHQPCREFLLIVSHLPLDSSLRSAIFSLPLRVRRAIILSGRALHVDGHSGRTHQTYQACPRTGSLRCGCSWLYHSQRPHSLTEWRFLWCVFDSCDE